MVNQIISMHYSSDAHHDQASGPGFDTRLRMIQHVHVAWMSTTSHFQHKLNFPTNLEIHPSFHPCLVDLGILDGIFGFDGQKLAIQEYGIAGRVW